MNDNLLLSADPAWFDALEAQYQRDPGSVPADWRAFIEGKPLSALEAPRPNGASTPAPDGPDGRVLRLIDTYRARGYLVARFRESHPGGAPPLAEVLETVMNDLKAERAADLAAEKAAAAVSAGADLAATAEAQGFTLEEATAVRRGASVGSLGVSAAMDEALFEGEIATLQGPLDMPAGPVILSVTSRVEVGEDEIRVRAAEVRDTLVAGRRQQLLSAITRELSLEADVTYNTVLIQQVDDPAAAATTTGS
jgi:hypothetical protein